jgi:hypothetical protein
MTKPKISYQFQVWEDIDWEWQTLYETEKPSPESDLSLVECVNDWLDGVDDFGHVSQLKYRLLKITTIEETLAETTVQIKEGKRA